MLRATGDILLLIVLLSAVAVTSAVERVWLVVRVLRSRVQIGALLAIALASTALGQDVADPPAYLPHVEAYLDDGLHQCWRQTVDNGVAACYYLAVFNYGNTSDTFLVTGAATDPRWEVHFTNGASEITGAITGAGWITPTIESLSYHMIGVTATPLPGRALGNQVCTVTLGVASRADPTKRFLCSLWATCRLRRQADWAIYDGRAYVGLGIVNATGERQSYAQSTTRRVLLRYCLRVYNAGNSTGTFRITDPASRSGWSVRYHDYASNLETTSQVIAEGWTTPKVAPGCNRYIIVTLQPMPDLVQSSRRSVWVTATPTGSEIQSDVVRLEATWWSGRPPEAPPAPPFALLGNPTP